MTRLIDTHCHIHDPQYEYDTDAVVKAARQAGVEKMILVGTHLEDSRNAIAFTQKDPGFYASIGVHPHEADDWSTIARDFAKLAAQDKVVAVGECGLDYFYGHSSRENQLRAIDEQLAIAKQNGLPMIFHIRGAKDNPQAVFDDFWPIYKKYELPGVVHSFSAERTILDEILAHDLYVGLNGIMTFTKDDAQLEAAKAVPLTKLLLETDAPYLTPTPYRGTMNEPKNVGLVAEFLAGLRGEPLDELSEQTSRNAEKLFSIN